MSPMITLKPAVAARPTCGNSNVNGATPRIENQMTRLRPMGADRTARKAADCDGQQEQE